MLGSDEGIKPIQEKQVSRGENCVKLHRSFTTISLRWFGSECGEHGLDPQVRNIQRIFNQKNNRTIYN